MDRRAVRRAGTAVKLSSTCRVHSADRARMSRCGRSRRSHPAPSGGERAALRATGFCHQRPEELPFLVYQQTTDHCRSPTRRSASKHIAQRRGKPSEQFVRAAQSQLNEGRWIAPPAFPLFMIPFRICVTYSFRVGCCPNRSPCARRIPIPCGAPYRSTHPAVAEPWTPA
jgi:hypothetical protein